MNAIANDPDRSIDELDAGSRINAVNYRLLASSLATRAGITSCVRMAAPFRDAVIVRTIAPTTTFPTIPPWRCVILAASIV
jgi:hypothetical protein